MCVCRTQLRWFWDGEDEDHFGGTGSERAPTTTTTTTTKMSCEAIADNRPVTGDGKFDNAFIRFGECEGDEVRETLTGSFAYRPRPRVPGEECRGYIYWLCLHSTSKWTWIRIDFSSTIYRRWRGILMLKLERRRQDDL